MVLTVQGSWHVRTLRKDRARRLIQTSEADLANPEAERSYDWMFDNVKLGNFMELYAEIQHATWSFRREHFWPG